MELSTYQENVLAHAVDPDAGNAVVNAVAGSGKTETLRLTAEAIQGRGRTRIKAVCFNKPAAEQLQSRMGRSAECSTLHSVGLAAWTAGGRPEIAGDKTPRIVRHLQAQGQIPRWMPAGKVKKVVGLAKAEGLVPEGAAVQGRGLSGLLPDTDDAWINLLEHYGIDTDARLTPAALVGAARSVLRMSIAWGQRIVDFDDMLYLPTLTEGAVFPTYPWVFVDETQDVSGLQREMLLRMVATGGGRLLAVGDRNQAIYGWRGADVGSMGTIAERSSAKLLPLSICYRCPRKVVALAQAIVPQIEPAPGAPEGVVEERTSFRADEFEAGDLVICRNRAPVLKLAYRLMGFGKPVRVMGGQGASEGIITFVEGFGESSVERMLDKLDAWATRAIARAEQKEDEDAAIVAHDRQDTIVAIAEGGNAETVSALCAQIRDLFDGDPEGKVLVGTGHGSKGLQARRVWILDRSLVPSRGAKLPWQLEQERNLWYVMLTRAQEELRFIRSDGLR